MLTLVNTAIFAIVALFNSYSSSHRLLVKPDNMSILFATISERKLAQPKHFAIKLNITDWWDQTVDDNLRVDLFFKLSNSGCALCHHVLSHTRRGMKGNNMNHRRGASSAAFCFFFCYYSHIASTTWNRGLTRSDQQSASESGIKRAHKVRELQSVWISPEEQPEARWRQE